MRSMLVAVRVAWLRNERGWLICDAYTEPDDGRPVALPRPCGDLPGDEGQLAEGLEDPHLVRPEDPHVGRSAARRFAAARESAVLAVPAPRGDAPVLAGLRLPRALGPVLAAPAVVLAAPAVVAAVPARQGRHRLLARDLLPRRPDRVGLHRHAADRPGQVRPGHARPRLAVFGPPPPGHAGRKRTAAGHPGRRAVSAVRPRPRHDRRV